MVATPCPLLIAIPVAIIGAISLSARRGIIIKDPAVLEKIDFALPPGGVVTANNQIGTTGSVLAAIPYSYTVS